MKTLSWKNKSQLVFKKVSAKILPQKFWKDPLHPPTQKFWLEAKRGPKSGPKMTSLMVFFYDLFQCAHFGFWEKKNLFLSQLLQLWDCGWRISVVFQVIDKFLKLYTTSVMDANIKKCKVSQHFYSMSTPDKVYKKPKYLTDYL